MPAAGDILVVCDALVEWIEAALDPPTSATVGRLYLAPLELARESGRLVWLFPARYQSGPATRGEDEEVYAIAAVVAERYDGDGEPPKEWIDERVSFVQAAVFDRLDFTRQWLDLPDGRRLWTQSADCTVYSAERLERKLFWSELTFEFREIKPV